jgi:hypothetical protein
MSAFAEEPPGGEGITARALNRAGDASTDAHDRAELSAYIQSVKRHADRQRGEVDVSTIDEEVAALERELAELERSRSAHVSGRVSIGVREVSRGEGSPGAG